LHKRHRYGIDGYDGYYQDISKYPMAVRNNGGGYFNHTFYWESMKHNGGGLPTGKLKEAILNLSAPLMSSKKQFQMQAKPDSAAAGHGYASILKVPCSSVQLQIRIIL